jgi:hypothetical protein
MENLSISNLKLFSPSKILIKWEKVGFKSFMEKINIFQKNEDGYKTCFLIYFKFILKKKKITI